MVIFRCKDSIVLYIHKYGPFDIWPLHNQHSCILWLLQYTMTKSPAVNRSCYLPCTYTDRKREKYPTQYVLHCPSIATVLRNAHINEMENKRKIYSNTDWIFFFGDTIFFKNTFFLQNFAAQPIYSIFSISKNLLSDETI